MSSHLVAVVVFLHMEMFRLVLKYSSVRREREGQSSMMALLYFDPLLS